MAEKRQRAAALQGDGTGADASECVIELWARMARGETGCDVYWPEWLWQHWDFR
jgi:hypothetical protein